MRLIQPFQYIVGITSLEDVDCDQFNKFAKEIFEKNPSVISSNSGGYQSPDLLSIPQIQELSERLQKAIRSYTGYFQFKNKLKMTNLWLNVNSTKDSNVLHDHPQCKLSGVFYTNAPENCGDLIFSNPSETQHFFKDEDLIEFNDFNCGKHTVTPANKMVVIFPSYLKHEVGPNLNKNKRISFSFNLN